jgi:Holliday junction resolvase
MGRMQRNKGASFERDVCKLFEHALNGREFNRNIGQSRDGANDIDIGPLCVEVKIRKTLGTIYGWLQQCIDSLPTFAKKNGHAGIPIVVARQDGDVAPIVILRLSDFLILTRDELNAHFDDAELESRRL